MLSSRPTVRRTTICFITLTATTYLYTLSLHDALPISIAFGMGGHLDRLRRQGRYDVAFRLQENRWNGTIAPQLVVRSEEHTSELQSLRHLVCRLLLEKKKTESSSPGPMRMI